MNKLKKILSLRPKEFFSLCIVLIYQCVRKIFFSLLSDIRKKKVNGSFSQPTLLKGQGSISIGYSKLGYIHSPNFLSLYGYIEARKRTAEITIGDNTIINNGFVVIADDSFIKIGNDCLIGVQVSILNSDFHELEVDKRNSGNHISLPVIIEDNVFIGNNVTILKGVTIGKNSVIGSNSVVISNIPGNTIAAGNPAKVIKEICSGVQAL